MRVFFLYFSRWYVRVPTASVLSVIQCVVVVSDDMSFLDCQIVNDCISMLYFSVC